MEDIRNIKKLAKAMGIPVGVMKIAMDNTVGIMYCGIKKYKSDECAKFLYNNIKEELAKKTIKDLEVALKNKVKPYGARNRDRIIELYSPGEDGKSHGYLSIYKILIAECHGDKKLEKEVISPSTIRTYLHQKWNVPKNKHHRRPKEAIAKKRAS